jgi:AcrR family transcriptional regulator
MSTTSTRTPRRQGRPSTDEAARLDHDVREQALRLFLTNGYEGTSMEAVAAAAGTTKASVYARFSSKDALFQHVLTWAVGRQDWPFPEPPPPAFDDLRAALRSIARAALHRALDPAMVQLSRIAVAQAARFPDVAGRVGELTWPRRQLVTELLRHHDSLGTVDASEPDVLAEQFLALVAGNPARLASFGVVRDLETQEHHLDVAIDVFLHGVMRDSSGATRRPKSASERRRSPAAGAVD